MNMMCMMCCDEHTNRDSCKSFYCVTLTNNHNQTEMDIQHTYEYDVHDVLWWAYWHAYVCGRINTEIGGYIRRNALVLVVIRSTQKHQRVQHCCNYLLEHKVNIAVTNSLTPSWLSEVAPYQYSNARDVSITACTGHFPMCCFTAGTDLPTPRYA